MKRGTRQPPTSLPLTNMAPGFAQEETDLSGTYHRRYVGGGQMAVGQNQWDTILV